MATANKPKNTRCDGSMTEAAYLAFIRSTLRAKSLRWPPRSAALNASRKPYIGPNKRQQWAYVCAICKQEFMGKNVVVDHHPVAAGSILSVADIGQFAENLFCNSTNLRVLCVPCHDCHTLAESQNITFEQARIEKLIIDICKQPIKKILAFIEENGYSSVAATNGVKRREVVTLIMNKQEKQK